MNTSCETHSTQGPLKAEKHELSKIKKVIGIVSGKGGVGKSLVTSLMAVTMKQEGYKTAVLDADITGPSIPKAFGITRKASANDSGIFPIPSQGGIDVMSVNLLLENDTDPVVWRGPLVGNMVKQFWTDVIWSDVDYLFIDMPPGTGDVPLTVFQSLQVDGIIIVTSPQDLVSMIVGKAINMAKKMDIPVLGLVENYSYFVCPDNGKKYHVFGESKIQEVAAAYGIPVLAQLPITPDFAQMVDQGRIEDYRGSEMKEAVKRVQKLMKVEGEKTMKIAVASDQEMVTGHFGHCEGFHIYEVDGDQIIGTHFVPNPGHKPGFLPNFLNDMGVEVIISGGMGGGAIDIFNEKDIEVVIGAQGTALSNVEKYLQGELQSTGSVCHSHDHEHECH
ncbi:MAG: P-loop NTPase [Vallitaleaceae bacterium]|nr:P-loop NTPase [Vallitaleaceae bacterium]